MSRNEQLRRRKAELLKSIAQIENDYPNDSLIKTYRDFLNHRDYLLCYQFNFRVLESLVDLALSLWETNERISRISLITMIKRYGFKPSWGQIKPDKSYTAEFNMKVLQLFRKCFEKPEKLTGKQQNEALRMCNFMLIGAELESDGLQWLCDHANAGNYMYNRALRHPYPSKIVSDWVSRNWNTDMFRLRRAEAAGWLLDENPTFELDRNVLEEDFHYANKKDQELLDEYESSLAVDQLLGGPKRFPKEFDLGADDDAWSDFNLPLLTPEFKLTQRSYHIPTVYSDQLGQSIPDFDGIETWFKSEIDAHYHRTMIWAIAYSRLASLKKEDLLKAYYSEDYYDSLYVIAKRGKMVNLLRWLFDQTNR